MTVRAVIFDFDGTIADSFDVLLEVIADLFEVEDGLDEERIESFRNMTTEEVLEELDISKFKALLYYRQGKRAFAERLDEVTLFEGMRDVLHELDASYTLGVLTNNDASTASSFLERSGVADVFDFVEDSGLLESKARALRRLVDEHADGEGKRVVYVGDQVSDVKAAHEAGCEALSVSWGYNSPSFLAENNPDRLVDTPDEIVSVVQSL